MPVAPRPFKVTCPKCNYSKVVRPKSDALNPMDWINTCPKCDAKMDREILSGISKFLDDFFTKFK